MRRFSPLCAVWIFSLTMIIFVSCSQSEKVGVQYGRGGFTPGDDDTAADDATVDDSASDDDLDDDLDDDVDDSEDDDATTTVPVTTTSTIQTTTTTTSTTTTTAGPADIFFIDFENDNLGTLGAPWEVEESGSSTVRVVDWEKAGTGHVLEINGGFDYEYAWAGYGFPDVSADMGVSFDVYVTSGATLGFRFFENDQSASEITVYTEPTDGHLQTSIGDGSGGWEFADCGALPTDTWISLEFRIRFSGDYDVWVQGYPVADCSQLPLVYGDGTPFGYFWVIDWSDSAMGGLVDYDNFRGWYL